jgi:hypothetical protein
VLKLREVAYEEAGEPEEMPDLETTMLNTVIDLEKELKDLKQRIKAKEMKGAIEEDDLDRLKFVQEELQAILSQ